MPGGGRDGEYSHAEIDRQRPYSVTYPSIRLPGWGGVDVPSANGPTTLGCCPDGREYGRSYEPGFGRCRRRAELCGVIARPWRVPGIALPNSGIGPAGNR